jgi:hypothetical protein
VRKLPKRKPLTNEPSSDENVQDDPFSEEEERKVHMKVNEEDEHPEADFVDDATGGSDYDKCKPGRLALIEVTSADEVPSGRSRKGVTVVEV